MVTTWDTNIGWGSGSTFQTAASAGLRTATNTTQSSLLQQMMAASTQELRKQHTFDLSEFIGGQGPPGPAGPRGLPGLPGWASDYRPFTQIRSTPTFPTKRITHPNDKGEEDSYWTVGVVVQELARVGAFGGHTIDVQGWAQIVNNSAASRTVSIWMEYRPYGQDPSPSRILGGTDTPVGGVDTKVIAAGETGHLRVSAFFINTAGYKLLSLFGGIDLWDASLWARENHYGISGRDIYQYT